MKRRITKYLVLAAAAVAVVLLKRMRSEERGHLSAIDARLAMEEGTLAMITPEVQALMDQAKAATQIAPALDAGFKALTAQITTLTQTVQSSQSMTDQEKAQVTQITSDLTNSITTLQSDIPANVQPTPAPAPAPGPGPAPVA